MLHRTSRIVLLAASDRLAEFRDSLDATGDRILWGGFDAEKGCDLEREAEAALRFERTRPARIVRNGEVPAR